MSEAEEKKVEEGEESTTTVAAAEPPQAPEMPLNEQQIIGKYKEMRAQVQGIATKMAELDVDAGEHQYVAARSCFTEALWF